MTQYFGIWCNNNDKEYESVPSKSVNESMYCYVELSRSIMLFTGNDEVVTLLIIQNLLYCVAFMFFMYQWQINEGEEQCRGKLTQQRQFLVIYDDKY